jgi:hypothetical protein
MERIVCYSRSRQFRDWCGGIPEYEHLGVDTTADLASRLVEERDVLCAILHFRSLDEYAERLLASLAASFPLLHIVLVLEQGQGRVAGSIAQFYGDPGDPALLERLVTHIRSLERKDKRSRQRFDWPLVGHLSVAGGPEQSLRVRSISSSGAFLEASGPTPIPGVEATISIEFADFSILTTCEILPPRPPAGKFPAGFGVRFKDLTEGSQKIIDAIVHDELIRSLTEPGNPPREPAIGR